MTADTAGIALAWSAARATGLAVIALFVYAIARRRGPSASSRAALVGLLALSAAFPPAFLPWPSSWHWSSWTAPSATFDHPATEPEPAEAASLGERPGMIDAAESPPVPSFAAIPRTHIGGLETRANIDSQGRSLWRRWFSISPRVDGEPPRSVREAIRSAIRSAIHRGREGTLFDLGTPLASTRSASDPSIGLVGIASSSRSRGETGQPDAGLDDDGQVHETEVISYQQSKHIANSSKHSHEASPLWGAAWWAFAAGLVVALARFGAGLVAVRRLRLRSVAVDDFATLRELTEVAEAHGVRSTPALRASADLDAPAVVGWWRPTLLVPVDWSELPAADRRAALSHELAHIKRCDYPAWVAARASLALHYYHPLAYLLAGRLRLQQELAADAEAAPIVGGASAYRASLARLALRQDRSSRAFGAAWPARPLFPSRRTLLRRIEMLRNTEDRRRPSDSPAARFLTYAALVAAGLLLAGLRPPDANRAVAQDKPASTTPAPKVTADSPNGLTLEHVPDDAAFVLAARPAVFLDRPEIAALLDAFRGEPEVAQILAVADPASIEQVTVVLNRSVVGLALAGGGEMEAAFLGGGLIVRTKSPRDWRSVASAFLPVVESRHAGRNYYSVSIEETLTVGFFQPDERTLVVAPVPALFGYMTPSRGVAAHPWADAWREVAGGELAIAADVGSLVGPLLPMLTEDEEFALIGGTVSPLWEETRGLALGLDFSEGLGLKLTATCGDEAGAKRVERTLQAVLTLGENASDRLFPLIRREALGGDGEAAALLTLVDLGEQFLRGAEATREGVVVRMNLSSKVDLGSLIRLAMMVL